MSKVVKGVMLGTGTFAAINVALGFIQKMANLLENKHLMGIILLLGLLFSGFVTGSYIGKKGITYGAITGVVSYILTCLAILLFLLSKSLTLGTPLLELIKALSKFSASLLIAVLPIMLVASIITAFGGYLGERYTQRK